MFVGIECCENEGFVCIRPGTYANGISIIGINEVVGVVVHIWDTKLTSYSLTWLNAPICNAYDLNTVNFLESWDV